MIVDWVLHPFRHLRGGHTMMHGGPNGGMASTANPMARRLIFLRVDGARAGNRADLFAVGHSRTPLFFVDVDFPTLTVLGEKDLGPGTGWGKVPTPMF